MKLLAAKFAKRIKTGEYEHEDYQLEAQIEDGETGAEVLAGMKGEVIQAIDTDPAETKSAKSGKAKSAKKGKKNARPTDDEDSSSEDENNGDEDSEDEDASSDAEGNDDDEAADSEDNEDGDDSSDDDEDASDEEDAKPAKGKAGKSTKNFSGKTAPAKESSKKSFRKKPQSYNRTIEAHKEIFSSVLRSVAPNWKKDEASKKKAKIVSEKLEGTDFLDENGEVIESFKAAVKKGMAVKK